ncbi:MAG: hypothetical protein H6Q21_1083, partial [Bacteroidetes bacterium]|nr:hypothetical protein [Bacteroidota bacterium]
SQYRNQMLVVKAGAAVERIILLPEKN